MLTLRTAQILRALTLSIVVAGIAHAGVVDVTVVVTQSAGLFQYDYSISNGTANDLFDLDIAVTPGIGITGLTAPTGFETAYDPGLGLVSFLENTASFGATPISGFIFDSSIAPSQTEFAANLQNPSTLKIVTTSGSTQGPVVTPEPASWLLPLVPTALLFWRKRSLAYRR
jgi:hypothetical protein